MVNTSSCDKRDAVLAGMYLILERINYYYYSDLRSDSDLDSVRNSCDVLSIELESIE